MTSLKQSPLAVCIIKHNLPHVTAGVANDLLQLWHAWHVVNMVLRTVWRACLEISNTARTIISLRSSPLRMLMFVVSLKVASEAFRHLVSCLWIRKRAPYKWSARKLKEGERTLHKIQEKRESNTPKTKEAKIWFGQK